MEISVIIPHVEALIFASEKPLTTLDLLELVNNALAFMEERATLDQVESAMEAIREKYSAEFYPFEVRESGGGWQFLTKGAFHKTVALLNGDKFLKRLSTAALETLAIIAYKQPITKGEIENIRGVNCDYAVQKLLEKELIVILGRKEDAPGHPLIYATSKSFMDYFGINSPEELPKLNELMAQAAVMPTTVGEAHLVDTDLNAETEELTEGEAQMVVTANGDIEVVEETMETLGESETAGEEGLTTEEQAEEQTETAASEDGEEETAPEDDNEAGDDEEDEAGEEEQKD